MASSLRTGGDEMNPRSIQEIMDSIVALVKEGQAIHHLERKSTINEVMRREECINKADALLWVLGEREHLLKPKYGE
jgi:hypothetical protein